MQKKLVAASLLLAAGLVLPAISQAGVVVDVGIAPPAAVIETPPPLPQPGYIWAAGYWGWVGGRHVWVPGHYMVGRPGYRWAPDHWVAYGPRYHFVPGHWVR
jgi:hypothetical protein